MECSICDLTNPPGASCCDCGYDFNARAGGSRPSFYIRHRAAIWVVLTIVGLLAAFLLYAFFFLI
jgi:hypothetical protein